MSSIDEILELLSDGDWHNLTEISKSLKIPFEELDSAIHFLAKYGFVDVAEDLIRIKMKQDFKELVMEEDLKEEPEAAKPRPPMVMTIRGRINTLDSSENEIVVTGADLEIEGMNKNGRAAQQQQEEREAAEMNSLISVLRLLTDNEWHRYDEISAKLELTHDKLQALVKMLRENDLVIVHDKFGMLKLRQKVKIQP